MKKFVFLLISCLMCNMVFAQNNVIDRELQDVMNQKNDEMIDVSIVFKSQINSAKLQTKAEKKSDRSTRREFVVDELKEFSSKNQADVLSYLQAEEKGGRVSNINSLWIVNSISCKATKDVIYRLSSHPDVAVLTYNKEVQLLDESKAIEMNEDSDNNRGGSAAPHVIQINADDVWNQGYTGKNVIVAVLDSGTNTNHYDLKDHLWTGYIDTDDDGNPDTYVNGWNFISNNSNITDDYGHGTHCAGIVCGDGTIGNTVGMAPDASLMTVKIVNRAGGGSVAQMLSGVQFAIDNGADILSMSLGYKSSQITVAQKESIREAMDNVLTAGAIVCAAVGNDGNNYGAPNNVDYPAACPSPWKNTDQALSGGLSGVIAVGANDLVGQSSQGPSTWQDTRFNDYQYSKWINYCSYSGTQEDVNDVYSIDDKAYLWAVKYTPNMLKCFTALSKVSLFGPRIDMNITINIYEGGDNAPSTLLHTEDKDITAWSWNDIVLSEKVEIDQTKNLWVVFKSNSATAAAAAYGHITTANSNTRLISLDGGVTWTEAFDDIEDKNNRNTWLVRAFIEDTDGDTSEIGLIRPDITAPGYMILSLKHDMNNKYKQLSGTSQSTPCVAGVIALMLEKNPNLTPAQISEIIETTAANKPATKNNIVGAGRIDAWEAVSETEAGEQKPYIRLASFTPVTLQQGDNKQVNVTLKNYGKEASSSNTKYTISLNNDPYVTLDGSNTITVGSIAAKGAKESSFNVKVNPQTPNGHLVHLTLTTTDGDFRWEDEFSIKVTALPNIVFKSCSPGTIKPEDGEVTLNVVMQNNGTAASLNDTEITLFSIESSLEHFDIINNTSSVVPLGVDETATATFTVKAKENAEDDYLLDLFLETFIENNTPTSVIYEFENSLEGWTTFDAADNYDMFNNKVENIWWHSSEAVGHGKTGDNSHSGNGHLMSETTNKSLYEFTNPINDYLVSPNKIKITEDSKVSFYARANHEAYYAEHFGFAISTNSNDTESDFTTIREWHITEQQGTTWNKYTVNLSEYAGQEIYVAIRHFFTEEEWNDKMLADHGYNVDALNIDDMEFSNVIIDYHNVPTSNYDENYFNIVVSNPKDLPAPTGLAISDITTESMTLSWNAVDDAKSYNVFRGGELIANVTATTYTDNFLTHNTEYCYTVAAVSGSNVNEQCEPVCGTTLQKDYSVAIKSFSPEELFIDGNTTTSLNITFVNDGKYGHESRSSITLSSNDEYVTINTATANMSALNPEAEISKSFEIVISENVPNNHTIRINANVTYLYSPYTSWDLPLDIIAKNDPKAPKNVSVTAKTENSVTLSWNAVANAVSYNIYRDDVLVGSTSSTTYYDGGLSSSTEYHYYVTSVGSDSESDRSKEVVATTNAASEGIVLQSFTMGTAIGQNIELTATLINKGTEATPAATTATLTCEDAYVTIVDGTDDLGSMEAGATATASFTIKLASNIPSNYNIDFAVTAEYEGEGGGGSDFVYYNFEDGFNGWTIIDADGDSHTWFHYPTTQMSVHGMSNPGAHGGSGYLLNSSYCSQHGKALTPDDFIVSPTMIKATAETTISFWVRAQGSSKYSQEHYGVAVSETSNSLANSFTTIYEATINPNVSSDASLFGWNEITVSLGDYSGKNIYVAIRHFDCTDKQAIGIDDITITGLAVDSGESYTSSFSVVANQSLNVFAGTGLWSDASKWSKMSVPTSSEDIAINGNATINNGDITVNSLMINNGKLTVNNGATLTVNASFINTSAASLVINDGAQIFQNNENVAATFNMNMANWNGANGWQFIASPLKNANVADFAPETDDYDLFKYVGSADYEWVNYKGHVNEFETTFQQGRAYLASYETETTATFTGNLNHETSFTFSDIKAYDAEDRFNNFYLLGNPFTFDMDWSKMSVNGIYENGFATIKADGNYNYHDNTESVSVGDGFFVLVNAQGPSLSYNVSKRQNDRSEKACSINIVATSNEGSDNVVISLAGQEEQGFDKLQNFNDGIAEIYVSENGRRYGIKSYDADVQEIEVNFKAKEMGNYTISIEPNGKFNTVTLVDRFTGVETNMLLEDYHFTATSGDNHDRFILRFDNSQQSTANGNFAYVSGEELILSVEGSVQIIDVMGRMVYSNDVTSDNNRINVSELNSSAYIVRVVNEEGVKVQKIIL